MNGARLLSQCGTRCCRPAWHWSSCAGQQTHHARHLAPSHAVLSQTWSNGKKKRRLDEVCCELAPEHSRKVIQSFILAGKVFVNDEKVTKAGQQIPASADVDIRAQVPKFVSRAGLKLEKALHQFDISAEGLVCLDSGLSTGGFTDCLLQRGALQVFGVDVGYGQVAEKVRTDDRVTILERTNLRTLTPGALGGAKVDLVTLDLSFISVLKVLPAVCAVAVPQAEAVVLIKPQFEAGLGVVSKGGVVRDTAVHESVISKVTEGFATCGWRRAAVIESPVRGAKGGNVEFLGHFVRVEETDGVELQDSMDAPEEETVDFGVNLLYQTELLTV